MTVLSLDSEELKVQECMVLWTELSFVKYNSLCMRIWTPEAINLLSTVNANWTKNSYSGVAIPSMQCRSTDSPLAESDKYNDSSYDKQRLFQLDYLPL